jgi:plastocyanin
MRPRRTLTAVTVRVLPGVVMALLAAACGSTITRSSPSIPDALLEASQPHTDDPTVHVTRSGVNPQVLEMHVPVTVTFVNDDTLAHTIEAAPELQYSDCPEMSELRPMAPGGRTTVTFHRGNIICAYHDAAQPGSFAFQGVVALH